MPDFFGKAKKQGLILAGLLGHGCKLARMMNWIGKEDKKEAWPQEEGC